MSFLSSYEILYPKYVNVFACSNGLLYIKILILIVISLKYHFSLGTLIVNSFICCAKHKMLLVNNPSPT